jgi:hypothetical protein
LPGKLDNIGRETLLVVTTVRDLALRRAMLPERRTGATLGDVQLRSDLLNAGAAKTSKPRSHESRNLGIRLRRRSQRAEEARLSPFEFALD